MTFSQDGSTFAGAVHAGFVDTYRIGGDRISRVLHHASLSRRLRRVSSLALSPDGELLATAGNDGLIRIWESKSGHNMRVIQHSKGAERRESVAEIDFSTDGKWLASLGGDKVRIWKVETGEPNPQWGVADHISAEGISFISNGELVAYYGDTVEYWEVESGRRERRLSTPGKVLAVGRSGIAALSGIQDSGGGSLKLWDLSGHEMVQRIEYSLDPGRVAALSPEGRYVATVRTTSTDITYDVEGLPIYNEWSDLYVWDIQSGEKVFSKSSRLGDGDAEFGPGGLLSFGVDKGMASIWRLPL
ncbi:WD40 repeat domain-containing protein [Kitasatospora atroaurantiaca]|nr:hypothetical protein [Kitasatospora atroaurantiaca]